MCSWGYAIFGQTHKSMYLKMFNSLKELSALPPTRKPKIPIRAADMNNWHTESSATTAVVLQILSASIKESSLLILFHITSAYNKPAISIQRSEDNGFS